MARERRNFSAKEKVAAVKRHLVDGVSVSDVCEGLGIRPAQFYDWQKRLFEEGEGAFSRGGRGGGREKEDAARIEALEAKVRKRDEALSELMEEHLALKKKSRGEI